MTHSLLVPTAELVTSTGLTTSKLNLNPSDHLNGK